MNLPKLTKCIILIWLPLANLVLLRKNQLDGRNRRERNLLLFLHRDDKKNFRENVENKMDEKFAMNLSTKPNFLELLTGDKKISKNFHVKNSAELNFERKFYVFTKSEVERKSAHDLAHSLMKHLSALMFDDNNNNRNNNSYNNINSNNSNKYNNKSNNKIYNKTRDRSLMMPTTIREKRRNNRKLLDININSDDHKREVEGDILETNMPESTTPLEDYDELEEIKENNETNGMAIFLKYFFFPVKIMSH